MRVSGVHTPVTSIRGSYDRINRASVYCSLFRHVQCRSAANNETGDDIDGRGSLHWSGEPEMQRSHNLINHNLINHNLNRNHNPNINNGHEPNTDITCTSVTLHD